MLDSLRIREWTGSIQVSANPSSVFEFLSQKQNLERLIFPHLKFKWLVPPPENLSANTDWECSLKFMGIPLHWKLEITEWNPPQSMVFKQVEGPFLHWEHRQSFADKNSGTLLTDDVRYALPGFIFEPLVYAAVSRFIRAVFAYREQTLSLLFL